MDKFVRRDQRPLETFSEFVMTIERFASILNPSEDYAVTAGIIIAHVNSVTYSIVKFSPCPINAREMQDLVLKTHCSY